MTDLTVAEMMEVQSGLVGDLFNPKKEAEHLAQFRRDLPRMDIKLRTRDIAGGEDTLITGDDFEPSVRAMVAHRNALVAQQTPPGEAVRAERILGLIHQGILGDVCVIMSRKSDIRVDELSYHHSGIAKTEDRSPPSIEIEFIGDDIKINVTQSVNAITMQAILGDERESRFEFQGPSDPRLQSKDLAINLTVTKDGTIRCDRAAIPDFSQYRPASSRGAGVDLESHIRGTLDMLDAELAVKRQAERELQQASTTRQSSPTRGVFFKWFGFSGSPTSSRQDTCTHVAQHVPIAVRAG